MARDPVRVLDDYYLAITLLVTVGYQLAFFAVAFALKFDKLTDFAGGTNFALLAALTLALSRRPDTRQLVASLLLAAWALRLAGFLLFRVLRTGSDARFDGKRDRFLPFLGFWVFQMLWVWAVSLPVTVLNSPAVQASGYVQRGFGTPCDVAGVVMFGVGFLVESVSDLQRFLWREKHGGGGGAFCSSGLFALSRHPNYFGEILLQFGIFTIAVSPAACGYIGGQPFKALYATILGPCFLTCLLMFVSGLPLSERSGAKKRYEKGGETWANYQRYLERTSVLIPFPPQLYAHLPTFIKRTVFLEFPMYVFDPAKHADAGQGQAAAEEGNHQGGDRQSREGLVGKQQQERRS
ncbi:uncharacterized protein E0L32_003340 [Thyridium curvatum]|uniref:Uncharacterized protein n=1 Tax=Thyridium curvatum TaxID=1093900 RepID=A0A507B4N2_9PEZI|nr:uncharacterized protein E0L32_003340 [Thyridium curvatum]TPX17222.1 hypothetical protein E0L32_003340 [Thyridium curvatum]